MATGSSAALVVLVVAFPAGAVAVTTGFKIEGGDGTPLSIRDVLSPQYRRRSHQQRMTAPLKILSPRFFRTVARSTGWNASVVLTILGALLAADLFIFALLMMNPPSDGAR